MSTCVFVAARIPGFLRLKVQVEKVTYMTRWGVILKAALESNTCSLLPATFCAASQARRQARTCSGRLRSKSQRSFVRASMPHSLPMDRRAAGRWGVPLCPGVRELTGTCARRCAAYYVKRIRACRAWLIHGSTSSWLEATLALGWWWGAASSEQGWLHETKDKKSR